MAGVFFEERNASQGNAKADLVSTSFHQPDATYFMLAGANVNPNLIDASESLRTKESKACISIPIRSVSVQPYSISLVISEHGI